MVLQPQVRARPATMPPAGRLKQRRSLHVGGALMPTSWLPLEVGGAKTLGDVAGRSLLAELALQGGDVAPPRCQISSSLHVRLHPCALHQPQAREQPGLT